MAIHLTSDTHFGHTNVIKYCQRPFLKDQALGWVDDNLDVEAMNATMEARWNGIVGPEDEVYHLGDFQLGPGATFDQRLRERRARLNGRIHLVLGNHDRSAKRYLDAGFDTVSKAWIAVDYQGQRFVMSHRPMEAKPLVHAYYLCGHVHEKWRYHEGVLNVGVDQWGFQPISMDFALDFLREKWDSGE